MSAPTFNLRKNVWFAIAEFVMSIGLVFASYRLVIAHDGVEAVGLWSTLFAWISLIRVGDFGMASATLRFVALDGVVDGRAKARRYIEVGLITNAVLFAVLAIAGYAAISAALDFLVGPDYAAEARQLLPLMLVGFLLFNLTSVVLGALQGLHMGFVRSQLAVLGSVAQLLGVTLLVPRLGLVGLAWAQIIQHVLVLVIGWFVTQRAIGKASSISWHDRISCLRDMAGFGVSSQFASVSNALFEPVSKILVSQFGGLYAQGLYELAYKTVWLTRNAVVAGVTATVPTMVAQYRQDPSAVSATYRRALAMTCLGTGVLMVLVTLLSPIISVVWLGKFIPDYPLFVATLALGAFLSAAGAPAYGLAQVTGDMRNNIVVNLGTLVALILGGLAAALTLHLYGLIGAIAFAMGLGGVWIKARNEGLLDVRFPAHGGVPS